MFQLMLEKDAQDKRDYTKTLGARLNGRRISGPNASISDVLTAIEKELRTSCEQCCRCDLRFDVGFPTDPVPDASEIEDRVDKTMKEFNRSPDG